MKTAIYCILTAVISAVFATYLILFNPKTNLYEAVKMLKECREDKERENCSLSVSSYSWHELDVVDFEAKDTAPTKENYHIHYAATNYAIHKIKIRYDGMINLVDTQEKENTIQDGDFIKEMLKTCKESSVSILEDVNQEYLK